MCTSWQWKSFSPSILGFTCQDHPTSAPYPSSFTYYKRAEPGKLPKSNALSEIGEHWLEWETYCHFFAFQYSNSYMSADVIIKVVMILQHVWSGGEVHTEFWWGNLRERDHMEETGVDCRIILRWIFRKWVAKTWTRLSWLRIGTGDGHWWMR